MQRSARRHAVTSLRLLVLPAAFVAVPAPTFAAFSEAPLTNTSQLLAPDATFPDLLAAANFRYAPAQGDAAGPVNGITFENVDPRGGVQTLSTGVGVDIMGAGSDSDRSRFQNTAATISGPDDVNLESVANTIGFVGFTEISTIYMENLPFSQLVRVQLIGGDAGSGLQNWFGDLTITANGTTVGTWNAADDNDTTASIATFDATTSPQGILTIELAVNNPPLPGTNGSFAGYGAAVVTGVPEPTSPCLLAAAGLAALRRRRHGPVRRD